MDVALCIKKLVPEAQYGGSVTANTEEAYTNIRWNDSRPKPSWSELSAESASVDADLESEKKMWNLEEKVNAEMRLIAIGGLVDKKEITSVEAQSLRSLIPIQKQDKTVSF